MYSSASAFPPPCSAMIPTGHTIPVKTRSTRRMQVNFVESGRWQLRPHTLLAVQIPPLGRRSGEHSGEAEGGGEIAFGIRHSAVSSQHSAFSPLASSEL